VTDALVDLADRDQVEFGFRPYGHPPARPVPDENDEILFSLPGQHPAYRAQWIRYSSNFLAHGLDDEAHHEG